MAYIFSPSVNGFFPVALRGHYEQHDSWPDDGVSVTDDEYLTFASQPPERKVRGASENGHPCWIKAPAPMQPTAEQIVASNTAQRGRLLAAAAVAMGPYQDMFDEGVATAPDMDTLSAWRRYRIALSRLDLTLMTITWPEAPQ